MTSIASNEQLTATPEARSLIAQGMSHVNDYSSLTRPFERLFITDSQSHSYRGDEDEIVWPLHSPRKATPPLVADGSSAHQTPMSDMHNSPGRSPNPEEDHYVLIRGDYGSKVYTPPSRGKRGHRSTMSESAVPYYAHTMGKTSPQRDHYANPAYRNSPEFGVHSRGFLTGSNGIQPSSIVSSKATMETRGSQKKLWSEEIEQMDQPPLQMHVDKSSSSVFINLKPAPARPHSTTGEVSVSPIFSKSQSIRDDTRRKRSNRRKAELNKNATQSSSTPNSRSEVDKKQGKSTPSALSTTRNGRNKVNAWKRQPGNPKGTGNAEGQVVTVTSTPSTAASTPRGLGQRSVVDDVSEIGDGMPSGLSHDKERILSVAYDEAVKFMNSFILDPSYYTSKASRLTFLQALIVELGLVSVHDPTLALPGTLSSAKALLKSHAFLNVRDYLAVRAQGLEALRAAMHPSKRSLIKELRGTKRTIEMQDGERRVARMDGRRAPIGWVKETGLTVLLVSCQ